MPEIQHRLWSLLTAVADRPEFSLACGQLSNCAFDGPRSRILILRSVDQQRRLLFSHTDLRSPKVGQLGNDPRVTWLFYDHERRIQLRLWGSVTIHTGNETAHAFWSVARPETRQLYLAPQGPGVPVASPPQKGPGNGEPEDDEGFRRFSVLSTLVQGMDVLQLRPLGNLRAEFTWNGRAWEGRWMSP